MWPKFEWERVCQLLASVDFAYVAVFLATANSVSSPCGLGSEYYGPSALQSIDVINTYFRACLVLVSFAGICIKHASTENKWRDGFAVVYCVLSVVVVVLGVFTSVFVDKLDCPKTDHLMGCKDAEYWMVPRNYCKAQLAAAKDTHGCNVPESDLDRTQMCVRLGRAPLVNGAFGAWVIRTVVCDVARIALVIWFMKTSNRQVAPGNAQESNRNNAELNVARASSRNASEALDANATLLAPAYDDGVIRQSPHVRKRASATYKIDF